MLRIAVDDSKSSSKLSSKFGARPQQVGKLLKFAAELRLDVIGVSFHVGCKCTHSSVFKQAIADARHVFDKAVNKAPDWTGEVLFKEQKFLKNIETFLSDNVGLPDEPAGYRWRVLGSRRFPS